MLKKDTIFTIIAFAVLTIFAALILYFMLQTK